MPRRNRVPESVSTETPKARKTEARRRREIEDLRRTEDRPSMSARGSVNARPTLTREQYRELMSRGGQGDPDAMLGRPDRNPLLVASQMAGAPATLVSTGAGLAKMAADIHRGHPEELIPSALSIVPGLKLNRLLFASREAPSTMEFLLYDRNNPDAAPTILPVPYKASAVGALSPARAGTSDKVAATFTRGFGKLMDILKDGPEKEALLKHSPEYADVEFLVGSGMPDGTLGMAGRNPQTGNRAVLLSDKFLYGDMHGLAKLDGLVMEPLDVVAHEGGAHIAQSIDNAYIGTTPENVYGTAFKDIQTAVLLRARGDSTPVRINARSGTNMLNYGDLEKAVKARYPEDVQNAFFFEPDVSDKGIMYGLMRDEINYNAYRNTAGEVHAFDIGARSADPSLRSNPVKELPKNALRFRESDWGTQQDAKGGDTSPAEDESIPEPSGSSVSSPAGGGPRIVINPSTFRNEKDALCVAFNEAFRLVMEEMEFDPVAEPTEAQRRFFSDTAYRDDELQLRRTILARICTFDTSVKDPTDEQLQEAVEFLGSVLEAGAPQNDWERQAVERLRDVIAQVAEKGQRAKSDSTTPQKAASESRASRADEPLTPDDDVTMAAGGLQM